MNKSAEITQNLRTWCQERHIHPETIELESDVTCLLIPPPHCTAGKMDDLFRYASTLVSPGLDVQKRHIPTGTVVVISESILSIDELHDVIDEVQHEYTPFDEKLSTALQLSKPMESQRKRGPHAFRRRSALNPFRSSIQDHDTESGPTRGKGHTKAGPLSTVDQKITEALEGIATPDDVQPQEGLKSLLSALKSSGLDRALKTAGVAWKAAEPGRHMITFTKQKVPILQRTTLDLADPKELSATLAQLTSIAQGKAPQAAEIELNIAKERAAKAGERRKALDDIANQVIQQNVPVRAAEAQAQAAAKPVK